MSGRVADIQAFLVGNGWGEAVIKPVAGDAGVRRYSRLRLGERAAILMDWAPCPADEYSLAVKLAGGLAPFLEIAEFLRENNLSAPETIAVDEERGLLLQEDFGDFSFGEFWKKDVPKRKEAYRHAVSVLVALLGAPPIEKDSYSGDIMMKEAGLFLEHYLPFRNIHLPERAYTEWEEIWRELLPHLMSTAQVLVLRDYHSPNLLYLPEREGVRQCGIIDFQDGLWGTACYDLVSLLQDGRIAIAADFEKEMLSFYLAESGAEEKSFLSAYWIVSVQRNCKILGIFTRLAGEGRRGYLAHLDHLEGYLRRALQQPVLKPLRKWWGDYVYTD